MCVCACLRFSHQFRFTLKFHSICMQNTAAFQWNSILNLRHSFDLANRLKLINTKAYWPCVHVCLMFIYSPLVTYPNQNVYGKFPITIEYKNSYRIPCKIERWVFGALCVCERECFGRYNVYSIELNCEWRIEWKIHPQIELCILKHIFE